MDSPKFTRYNQVLIKCVQHKWKQNYWFLRNLLVHLNQKLQITALLILDVFVEVETEIYVDKVSNLLRIGSLPSSIFGLKMV